MTGLGRVCDRCRGTGVIYAGHGRRQVCPACSTASARSTRASSQYEAAERLRSCWARFVRGETGIENLRLSVSGALRAGLTVEQLHRRTGVTLEIARAVQRGQEILV